MVEEEARTIADVKDLLYPTTVGPMSAEEAEGTGGRGKGGGEDN